MLADGRVDERDIVSPLLTVANSRHIGGGIEVSPYASFDDGQLDLVWLDHMPKLGELARIVPNVYNGRLLAHPLFGWRRVREVEISRIEGYPVPPRLMADGQYEGEQTEKETAKDRAPLEKEPPAVADQQLRRLDDRSSVVIRRDGRDPLTGEFAC